MKRIIILFVIISLFAGGCSGDEEVEEAEIEEEVEEAEIEIVEEEERVEEEVGEKVAIPKNPLLFLGKTEEEVKQELGEPFMVYHYPATETTVEDTTLSFSSDEIVMTYFGDSKKIGLVYLHEDMEVSGVSVGMTFTEVVDKLGKPKEELEIIDAGIKTWQKRWLIEENVELWLGSNDGEKIIRGIIIDTRYFPETEN